VNLYFEFQSSFKNKKLNLKTTIFCEAKKNHQIFNPKAHAVNHQIKKT